MIEIVIFPILFLISFFLLKNIQLGFAMVISFDLLFIRSITFMGLPIREILMIITWFSFLYYRNYKLSFNGLYKKHFIVFTLGIFLILVFSSKEADWSFQLKHIFGLIYYFSYAYIAWQIYNTHSQLDLFKNVMLITISFMAIYGIFCYITTSNPYLSILEYMTNKPLIGNMIEETRGGLTGRTQSTMAHPLTWGGCACLFIFFFYKIEDKLKYILPLLLIINVLLTGGRSAFIALVISLLFIVIYQKRIKTLLYTTIVISIIVVTIYAIPFLEPYKGFIESSIFFWDDNISKESNIQGSSVSMRELQLLGVIGMIKDNPLFGLGHGYVDYYFSTYGAHPVLLGFESLLFNKLVEGGFINLFLWFYLFGVLFFSVNKIKKKYNLTENLSIIKGYVIFYLIYSLFTGFMMTFLYFIVLYAVLVKSIVITKNKKSSIRKI